ncbi:MAG: bifunctional diguanylate cyclase/phosphodiesterase [Bauldia sp.]|nr:bifunctional diguanylate cyclase/phosphodiesterase [Bauldia sp.]
MSYRDQVIARFGLRVVIPAVAVMIGALAIVIVSLSEMADQVNTIEDQMTTRSAEAALRVSLRNLSKTHKDYAVWDDAARNLYGGVNKVFLDENFASSTIEPMFFDTVMLVDEVGTLRYGVHRGEPLATLPSEVFGPQLLRLTRELIRDGKTYDYRSGFLSTRWGLVTFVVGTVVPFSPNFEPRAEHSRILILSRVFNSETATRLGDDFSIKDLRLADPAAKGSHGIDITDPDGAVIGALAWSPPSLGSEAHQRVSPTVFVMLALVGLTMAFLIAVALRGVREIERREAAARHAATHDALSGLPNRAALVAAIDGARGEQTGDHPPVAVVYLDLDGFKEVNDAFGHDTGDQLLIEVAKGFRERSGGYMLARIGGDEFAIVVRGPGAVKLACDLGWRLINFVSEPIEIDGRMITIGTSVGVAVMDSANASAEELLRQADVAMYQAKQNGPNRLFVYDAVIDTVRHERLEIADDLRKALSEDALDLVYQPVFNAGSRAIVGVEALLRWNRPRFGPLPPSVFVQIAEQSGLIDELGIWTIRRACRDGMAWPSIKVSVNVSPAQFRNPNFDGVVADILRSTGFPATRLELEVTESYFIANPEEARRAIDTIRAQGIAVSLDDFGTGYSSIGYLRSFSFDKLKLDRSLIMGLGQDERVQRLVKATIALAEALDLRVTAEGVETDDEAELLKAAGCAEFQGFFFAKPSAPDVISNLLQRQGRDPKAIARTA